MNIPSLYLICLVSCLLCATSTPHPKFLRKHAAYPSSARMKPDEERVLHVHVVPHTHDDVGWRKTVEQYYYGWNNTIDQRGYVNHILTSVVDCLTENEARTFTYVESKFLSMWWKEQTDETKDRVRFLVANQQLHFANGGWAMHDEASTHFSGMIDQTTLGHNFLLEELGVVPTVGWQLDPFGHSATQGSLMTEKMGFDALYMGRIDYQDLELRRRTRQCEGLWKTQSSSHSVFWGLTGSYYGNYGPYSGYCFDDLCDDERLVGLNATRLEQRLLNFLEYVRIQADQTQGEHIMLTMGSDFHFSKARVNFENIDVLISTLMMWQEFGLIDISSIVGYDRLSIFYSTPDYYTQCKFDEMKALRNATGASGDESIAWQTKTDDFFPYADSPHSFWTGYFTSRAAFKRFERFASSFLMAARQIRAFMGGCRGRLAVLEDALGVAQHHDAISGTGKQHVSDDYSYRLQRGLDMAVHYVESALRSALLDGTDMSDVTFCHQLNETSCAAAERTLRTNETFYVIVYNQLSIARKVNVRLPVAAAGFYRIANADQGRSDAQTVQTIKSSPVYATEAPKDVLVFRTADVPPTGVAVYAVSLRNEPRLRTAAVAAMSERNRRTIEKDSVVFSNKIISVSFDKGTGELQWVSRSNANVTLDLQQTWGYYTSFDSTMDTADPFFDSAMQNSGAYIFRPSEPEQPMAPIQAISRARFVDTPLGVEVHTVYSQPWIKQVTRIIEDEPFIEIEYTVGPIPIEDGRGKEIVSRFSTPLQTNGTFFTDSNGREFLQRRQNKRPTWDLSMHEPIAGNYYPVNAAMYIEDNDASLSVLVDRTQGGGSIRDGSIELMVQRRTLADDARGVDEPLNETMGGMTSYPPYGNATRIGEGVVVRGKHRILVGSGLSGAKFSRSLMDSTFAEPLIFIGSTSAPSIQHQRIGDLALLRRSLPPNLMLITFDGRSDGSYLLRLGHQYGPEEDDALSQPVKLDLVSLFPQKNISSVVETTLSGNQKWNDFVARRLSWDGREFGPYSKLDAASHELMLQIEPLDIRTFTITFSDKE